MYLVNAKMNEDESMIEGGDINVSDDFDVTKVSLRVTVGSGTCFVDWSMHGYENSVAAPYYIYGAKDGQPQAGKLSMGVTYTVTATPKCNGSTGSPLTKKFKLK
mmetsp:Transcript_35038/g.112164  ORF Transcript_35038/g.112164 Transcript_35038/m.112164 type:complete len:104 (-) Transcript_35038:63-374(-)